MKNLKKVVDNRQPFILYFDFFKTYAANILTLERRESLTRAAKKAGIRIFRKYNFVLFHIDFNRIGAAYIHLGAHFLRNDYASKLINVSDYTGGLHFCKPLLWKNYINDS